MRKRFFVLGILVGLAALVLAGCGGPGNGGGDNTYTVSGKITNVSGGGGVAGVVVSFGGTTATTGADGSWSMSGLKGTVTVTPVMANWTFTPATRTVSGAATNVDFVGAETVPPYAVSGRVTDGLGNGVQGVTISFTGGFGSVVTDASGNWSQSGLTAAATVTPSKQGWTFSPSSKSVSGAASDVSFSGTYTVSGRVTNSSGGAGVPDVLLTFNNGMGTATTASDGSWTKSGLSGTSTATPSKSGWGFAPPTASIGGPATNVNFTATYQAGTITGQIFEPSGSRAASGVQVKLQDDPSLPAVYTDINGQFSIDGVAPGTHTVKAGIGIFDAQASASVTVGQTVSVGAITLQQNGKVMLIQGGYQDTDTVLTDMGVQYDKVAGIVEKLLTNAAQMAQYNIIIIESYQPPEAQLPAVKQNLKAWVEAGGGLYVSDRSYAFVTGAFPGRITPYSKGGASSGTPITATIENPVFRTALGKNTADIKYADSGWTYIDAGSGTSIDLTGAYPIAAGGTRTGPLVVHFEDQLGVVYFSTYLLSDVTHQTEDATKLLRAVIFQL